MNNAYNLFLTSQEINRRLRRLFFTKADLVSSILSNWLHANAYISNGKRIYATDLADDFISSEERSHNLSFFKQQLYSLSTSAIKESISIFEMEISVRDNLRLVNFYINNNVFSISFERYQFFQKLNNNDEQIAEAILFYHALLPEFFSTKVIPEEEYTSQTIEGMRSVLDFSLDLSYCSFTYDDRYFGSLGKFNSVSNVTLNRKKIVFSLGKNIPLLLQVVDKLSNLVETGFEFIAVIYTDIWPLDRESKNYIVNQSDDGLVITWSKEKKIIEDSTYSVRGYSDVSFQSRINKATVVVFVAIINEEKKDLDIIFSAIYEFKSLKLQNVEYLHGQLDHGPILHEFRTLNYMEDVNRYETFGMLMSTHAIVSFTKDNMQRFVFGDNYNAIEYISKVYPFRENQIIYGKIAGHGLRYSVDEQIFEKVDQLTRIRKLPDSVYDYFYPSSWL